MSQETENITIEEKDLLFIEKEFSKTDKPLSLEELTKKLAYKKSSSQLSQEVKVYDPSRDYEIGDLIYKEYDEPLMVSSKGVEPFKGGVVLNVINKISYDDYNCEMLEVDYSGGGPFRKHIDYMKKTKTQVLLPCNIERKNAPSETLKKDRDPRLEELPMTDKDLKKLEKNLKSALSKSPKYFNWNGFWQLKEKQVKIEESKIKKVESFLREAKLSVETAELVTRFFNINPDQETFSLHCLSLNHTLDKKHKKDFVYVAPQNWGKWHLKPILNSFLDKLPVSAPKAKLPRFEQEKTEEIKSSREFPLKAYLTCREILSGGLKVPKSLNKDLSSLREYIFTDAEEEKDYTVYYYPSSYLFLGLKDFYENNNVPQGASLTLERKNISHFHFWIKRSKKKLSVAKIIYDAGKDTFSSSGEEAFTFALPNKIIHLQRETMNKLFSLYNQRDKLDLKELLILIFKNFGLEKEKFSLHYLRAYHLVDILKRTTEEDVIKTLLNSTEFKKSEKKKGLFLYQEKIEVEEEKELEAPAEIPPEPEAEKVTEEMPTVAPPEEAVPLEFKEEGEAVPVEAPPEAAPEVIKEPVEEERPKPPIKEKEFKKKRVKPRVEGERVFRKRKRERKFIEEKIELEESEQEALIAMKSREKKVVEEVKKKTPPKEKPKDYKPFVSEEPVFGVFAEKLKTALDEKTKKKKKK